MGRHRRSADVPPADDSADGAAGRHRGGRRRKGRIAVPVRTGLLGASAAMAVGAVAVASGLLPGGSQLTIGSGATNGGQVRADGMPQPQQQGGSAAAPSTGTPVSPSTGTGWTPAPVKPSSPAPAKPSATPSPESKPSTAPPEPPKSESPSSQAPAPGQTTDRAVSAPEAPAAPAGPNAAESAVLTLVNKERARVGCGPLRADSGLGALAQNFSDDMAERGFFDHTDPDGKTPWDRADKAGVKNLGGENIARGQATAQAVMDAWMNSEGHRANILNCDYTRIGVGVRTGSGGPWWTQDFGF
ncbi:CAP domain-containing protein [Streptomyces sp. NPDC051569]|uniref:CAP domain-containing protein n=1 Tax=Streptomyces sp. NPDC051569 TaxID=3365661 RepID=UPI00378928A9